MKLQLTKHVEEKSILELENPSFYKLGNTCMKIITDRALSVNPVGGYGHFMEIFYPDINGGMIELFVTKGKKITEDEFNEAYHTFHNDTVSIQLQKEPMPGVDLGSYDLKKLTA